MSGVMCRAWGCFGLIRCSMERRCSCRCGRAPSQRSGPSGTGVKQRASVTASAPATIRRVWPTAAGGSRQSVVFQFVKVMALVRSVHAIQTLDLVLSSAAAVVAVSPAARAQGRAAGRGRRAAPELAGREQVQGGQQHADPGCGRQRVQREGVPVADGSVDDRDGRLQQGGMAAGACGVARCPAPPAWTAPPRSTEWGEQRGEAGERSGGGDVEHGAPRGWFLPEAHEGAEGPGEGRSGDEERRRAGEPVVARRAPVPELVRGRGCRGRNTRRRGGRRSAAPPLRLP